jgi:hypothetical protein
MCNILKLLYIISHNPLNPKRLPQLIPYHAKKNKKINISFRGYGTVVCLEKKTLSKWGCTAAAIKKKGGGY